MCGIAGIHNLAAPQEISQDTLSRMIGLLRHRGPDGNGLYRDRQTGLAHTRLSIIDLEGGHQPMANEDETVWITFNGEIFNYRELRGPLEARGHRFRTNSDTEVIIHLYEEYGTDCLAQLNGQFAFAVWDRPRGRLFIARDRVGIRPVYYTTADGQLLFASEIKALFTDRRVRREIDVRGLDQVFTFWMTVPPRTVFSGVSELPAGHFLLAERGSVTVHRYWDLDFFAETGWKSEEDCADALRDLLVDATRLQLRADVPVGAYLSGGLDSSAVTAMIRSYTGTPLRTFSVAFDDQDFDESSHQQSMIEHLAADHSSIRCTYDDIGRVFRDVIWHAETPVLRTAPAPMYLLSRLVRTSGYRVVLTGEGADEFLAGYDLFKEVKVRRFLERDPGSKWRPLILKRLYPYLASSPVRSLAYAQKFFAADASGYPAQFYSHVPRWETTAKIKLFYSAELKAGLSGHQAIDDMSAFLPGERACDSISQAQYVEAKTLLPGYLLSSQGDRVAMAHSIEARYPFLDHRVIEFCAQLPVRYRMRALTEKYILKKSMQGLLPRSIVERTKQPYRSPDAKSIFHGSAAGEYLDLLSEQRVRDSGLFNAQAVAGLVRKCRSADGLGFKDNMAVIGIVSTLLLKDLFIDRWNEGGSAGERPAAVAAHADPALAAPDGT